MEPLDTVLIRELLPGDEAQATAAQRALESEEFDFLPTYSPAEPWAGYVRRLREGRQGRGIPEGWVRSALFVVVQDGRLLGRVSVRYELNAMLEHSGGHLGYGVVPAARRRGVASLLCRFALGELRAAGVERALVTCARDNAGSRATILGCGGAPDELAPRVADPQGIEMLRFWIPTAV